MFKVTQHTDTSLPLGTWFIDVQARQAYMRITLLDPRVLKAPTEYHHHVLPASGEQVLAFASDFAQECCFEEMEKGNYWTC
jgi:hypothetical protein